MHLPCWMLAYIIVMSGAVSGAVKTFSRQEPLDRRGEVFIETQKGAIHITVWNQPSIEIHVEVVPDRSSRKFVDGTDVGFSVSRGSVTVRTVYPAWAQDAIPPRGDEHLPFVNYDIRVPSTAKVHILDVKSEITISGLQSTLEIETVKSVVHVEALEGALRYHTLNGSADIQFARMSGDSEIKSNNAEIDIQVPGSSRLRLSTALGRRGRLQSNIAPGNPIDGGGVTLRLSTRLGVFRLRST